MLTENVIIVDGQNMSDTCENERVGAFIGLNISPDRISLAMHREAENLR